jgi:hypothetical protein
MHSQGSVTLSTEYPFDASERTKGSRVFALSYLHVQAGLLTCVLNKHGIIWRGKSSKFPAR